MEIVQGQVSASPVKSAQNLIQDNMKILVVF